MTKLCIDWPIAYTPMGLVYGDITFALAALYNNKHKTYKEDLRTLILKGKEVMLDNGAWEFGKSIDVERYIEIIIDLQPTYAVVPDVLKDRKGTQKVVREFFSSKNFKKIKGPNSNQNENKK